VVVDLLPWPETVFLIRGQTPNKAEPPFDTNSQRQGPGLWLVTDRAVHTPNELPALWRLRAVDLRRFRADAQARTAETLADELDAAMSRQSDEALTLADASRESGYNAESLGRLVREGKIPKAGRANAPRILRRDLPQKLTRVATSPTPSYDPVAEARSLRSRSSR